jgi:hypothetical protein
VKTSTPVVNIDESKITITDKDTLPVRFSSEIHPKNNLAQFIFETSEDQRYRMEMLPGALTDFHENVSDSLLFTANTKPLSDYGTISLQLQNVKQYPVIVQLLTEKFEIVNEQLLKEEATVYFDYIDPGNYFIRLVIDANANNRWDTGNFLQRLQPEDIVYYPKMIEVLANWSLNETFILD